MNNKTFIIVLVHLAQAAQGQEDRGVDDKELDKIFYRYWTNKMGQDNFTDIKNKSVDGIASTLRTLDFDARVKTKIVIHGFTYSAAAIWKLHNFAEAYYGAKKDVNLFIVDWSTTAKPPFYVHAARSVDEVGIRICNHLVPALEKVNVSLQDIQVIGHSLGSHVAGNLGRCLKGQLQRITALDPANPLFSFILSSSSLSKNDAKFVDVIHTNGGWLKQGCLGRTDQIGHVDFYVNIKTEKGFLGYFRFDNQHQPGCADPAWSSISAMVQEYIADLACSHLRAFDYYLESILNENAFESRPCSDWKKLYSLWGWLHVGNKCIKEDSLALNMGDNLDINTVQGYKGDTRFFLTTTKGENGKFSKDHFEL